MQTRVLDLSKCLDKFTEEELLDDMVCPKCKEDHCLKYIIAQVNCIAFSNIYTQENSYYLEASVTFADTIEAISI